jgi:hypothetical protein
MIDNLLPANKTLKNSLSSLRRKASNLRISIEELVGEVDKFDTRLDNMSTEMEIYKARLEREMGREVRRLEKELADAKKQVKQCLPVDLGTSSESLRIASTISVLECVLRHVCENAMDFRLMCYSYLFPAIVERVVSDADEAYYLDEIPSSTLEVIRRGKEYLTWIRSECDTHLTNPEEWETYVGPVSEWWRNDALPLLYGCRDSAWDLDLPLSLAEMQSWQDNPADRPTHFSKVFDAYEIYRKHKDEVFTDNGVRNFDLKMFTYGNGQ